MFNTQIKKLREKKGMSQRALAEELNVAQSTVGNWESGIREPSFEMLNKIAQCFNVSVDSLVSDINAEEEGSFITYPVIVGVRAGFNGQIEFEESGDSEQIPTEWVRGDSPDKFFVARVKGDSMYPMFLDGDRVLVHQTPSVDSGSIAVMRYEGDDITLKRIIYKQGEDWFEMQPINTAYPPKRIEGRKLAECGVIGEVKRLIRKF